MLFKSPFRKGGFRGISWSFNGLEKSPLPPFTKGGKFSEFSFKYYLVARLIKRPLFPAYLLEQIRAGHVYLYHGMSFRQTKSVLEETGCEGITKNPMKNPG